MKGLLTIVAILAVLAVLILIGGCGTYNKLVGLKQQVDRSWADVQNVYQRRADLIPNLVSTVEGAANFEKSTLKDVIEARQQVTKVQLDPNSAPTDPQSLQRFQQTQDQLSNTLAAPGRRGTLPGAKGERQFSGTAGATRGNRESHHGGTAEIQRDRAGI